MIRKDEEIDKYDERMALIIGKHFGFAEDFCKTAIAELLENEYISEEPPKFSRKSVARFFVNETHRILVQIHDLSSAEYDWLQKTAHANGIAFEFPYE